VGDYSIKKPKAKRKPMSGYATEDGRVTLSDPDQFEMEFSEAS
jgi:hypothetical protein